MNDRERLHRDRLIFGESFTKDGKRVDPRDVEIVPDVATVNAAFRYEAAVVREDGPVLWSVWAKRPQDNGFFDKVLISGSMEKADYVAQALNAYAKQGGIK